MHCKNVRVSLVRVTLLAVGLGLFLATSALSATPYQWTPAQAKAAIMVYADDLDLVSVACRGTGRKVQGRFVTFRCTANIKGESVGDPNTRAVYNAKTRRAGGLCFATARVPSGCLAPGKRARGDLTSVARAVYAKYGAPAQTFTVLPHGAGFYSWTWVSGETTHRGTVTFSPRPVVKVLS